MKRHYATVRMGPEGIRILAFLSRGYRDRFVTDYRDRYEARPIRRREIYQYLDKPESRRYLECCIVPCYEAWTLDISGLIGDVVTTDYRQSHLVRL